MSTEQSIASEGHCSDWNSFFADQIQRKRGLALAIHILKDPAEAEDVLQDASLSVLNHPHIEDKPNYFLKTVQHDCISRLRKRSYLMLVNATPWDELSNEESKEAFMQTEDSVFSCEMEEREKENHRLREIVRSCSQKLTDREKELFRSKLEGCSNREIARRRQEDVKVIRKDLNRLMAKMRYRCRQEDKKQRGQ